MTSAINALMKCNANLCKNADIPKYNPVNATIRKTTVQCLQTTCEKDLQKKKIPLPPLLPTGLLGRKNRVKRTRTASSRESHSANDSRIAQASAWKYACPCFESSFLYCSAGTDLIDNAQIVVLNTDRSIDCSAREPSIN